MASIKGSPRSYHKKFKFIIEVNGIQSSEWEKCSKLEAELAVAERNEGGRALPTKNLGRAKVTDLTLMRGATLDKDIYQWFKQCLDLVSDTGLLDSEYKRDLDIVVQDRDGSTIKRWRCYNAFPIKFSPGEWDNTSDDDLMEEVTLAFESFELIEGVLLGVTFLVRGLHLRAQGRHHGSERNRLPL